MNGKSSQKGAIQPGAAILLSLILVFGAIFSGPGLFQGDGENPAATFSASLGENRPESAGSLPLSLTVPAEAALGERVTFTLRANSVRDLAGFQASLRYDARGLQFAGAELDGGLLSRDGIQVGPAEAEGVIHLGAAACPVENCGERTDYREASRKSAALSGSPALAHFYFYVRAPGAYHIQVENVSLFDLTARGLYGTGLQADAALDPERLDLTGNHLINEADAFELLTTWEDLNKEGLCISEDYRSYDLNGSGCLDAGDMQMILSHWGEFTPDAPLDALSASSPEAVNAVFVVNSAGDGSDADLSDHVCETATPGECTLRAAIEQANWTPGHDTINFAIPNGPSCQGVITIAPASTLTTTIRIDDLDQAGMTVDGYSQCGASANTQPLHGNAVIKIQVEGNRTKDVEGLEVYSANNLVRGLAFFNWSDQIVIRGSRAFNNRFEGNIIGANATLTNSGTNIPDDQSDGIQIRTRAHDNFIGGTDPSQRNIITGNDQDGIGLEGAGVTGNVVVNNYIGVVQDGISRLQGSTGNRSDGMDIAAGAANNRIGGLNPHERNVFAGNNKDGIEISHQETTSGNQVLGNFIGLGADGVTAQGNRERGITFEDLPRDNQIYRNVIVDNRHSGIRFYTANGNLVYDNFIGVAPPGIGVNDVVPAPGEVALNTLMDLPNGIGTGGNEVRNGLYFTGGSQGNLIRNNIIANHPGAGILMDAKAGYLADPPTSFPANLVCEPYFNTFSQNRIYDNNGPGIKFLSGDCLGTATFPNQNIQPPIITHAGTTFVAGTTCANCVVEVFLSDKNALPDPGGEDRGEGLTFLGQATASAGGIFFVPLTGLTGGQILSATTTDALGNTSEFSLNVVAEADVEPPPTPVPPSPPPPVTPTGPPTGGVEIEYFLPLMQNGG